MKRCILALFAFVLISLAFATSAQAQYRYTLGLGGKTGSPYFAASAKYFLGSHSAIEGLASFGLYGVGLTGLYEYHIYIDPAPGLRWYFGGGAHVSTTSNRYYNPYADAYYGSAIAGLDGVIGLEYVFEKIPLGLSFDLMPVLNIAGYFGPWWNAGIGVRYLFK